MKTSKISQYLFIAISIILTFIILSKSIEDISKTYLETSIKQAVVVFASAKALNSVISFAQGTQAGPPGITFAVGEFLDPVNDLVERFSMIMLLSIISLGVQKIILIILSNQIFDYILISFLAGANLLILFKPNKIKQSAKFILLLLLVKFSVPMFSIGNNLIYNNFIKSDYNVERTNNKIDSITKDIEDINDRKEDESFFSFKTFDISAKINDLKNRANQVSNHMVDLIIIFSFRSILFPLLFIFLLHTSIKALLRAKTTIKRI
jgi:hypothetical protein